MNENVENQDPETKTAETPPEPDLDPKSKKIRNTCIYIASGAGLVMIGAMALVWVYGGGIEKRCLWGDFLGGI